jgi:histidinol-phosphate aminotransferase
MAKIKRKPLANRHIRNLSPYPLTKAIATLKHELGIPSIIKLASNENPLGPSPHVINSLQSALGTLHLYPEGDCSELKQALSSFMQIEPCQLTIGNGSDNILELIIKTYLRSTDTAVISEYAFCTIPLIMQSYGIKTNIEKAHHWGHDINAILNVFLINPNNPTGTMTTKQHFEKLLTTIPPHILIVVDEAYAEYIHHPDYPNSLYFLKYYPNLVMTRTFSKIYGLAALRLGYAISSADIANMLNRSRLPFNVNTMATKAALAALADQEHIQKSVRFNKQGMQQIQNELNKLDLQYIPSFGNFITIDVGNAANCYQKILHEGIMVRPLNNYNMPRHIRVTIGTMEQNEHFLGALKKVYQSTLLNIG